MSKLISATVDNQLLVYNWLIDLAVEGTRSGNEDGKETILDKVLVVEDFESGGFQPDTKLGVTETGDLGLAFRIFVGSEGENVREISLFNSYWGVIAQAAQFYFDFVDILKWRPAGTDNAPGEDPLVLDLDGDGIETTRFSQSNVFFDIDENFFSERTGWLSSDDGFLVWDQNADGRIEDASELFGSTTKGAFTQLAANDNRPQWCAA